MIHGDGACVSFFDLKHVDVPYVSLLCECLEPWRG